MPKISGNSLDKFNRSCSTLHQESNKIEFAIFRFFYDFLEVLQESANVLYYWRQGFALRPLEWFNLSQPYPRFTNNPLERKRTLQLGPWHGEAATPAGFRRAAGAPGQGGSGAWPHAHLRPRVADVVAEESPAWVHGDNRWRRPRRLSSGDGKHPAQTTSGTHRSYGV
jgi:hypothetical protein